MAGYQPTYISNNQTGLVQSRENFLLPNDAYPTLENAYVWRERIKRKQAYKLLGRLRRIQTAQALGNASGAGTFSGNIRTIFTLETNAEIEVGSVVVSDGVHTYTDNSLGVLVGSPSGTGTINYSTTAITLTGATAGAPLTITYNYYPNLPVMGLRSRELNSINAEMLIAFDQKYAYRFVSGWQEFIPGTTWTGTDSDFFWSTNYFVGDGNLKMFWETNFSGTIGDPIRYTNGILWVNFAPQINAAGDVLAQCLALLPFRGRLLAFNTLEGPSLAGSVQFFQRIRWSSIGTPFSVVSGAVTVVNANAWRSDIKGQGGFLDIPTAEAITAVGFVRDNLVIYCESSTWQLRYTGRSISPFQIEKVNSELGAESTFSAVQFDTSLVGIGDKGIVECDSYKSDRIDIKIPDLVYLFNNAQEGTKRVHGIRDFQERVAYWTYPYQPTGSKFPNRRLLYNYENDSWAIFTDSLTTLGTFQAPLSLKWSDFTNHVPSNQWKSQNYKWNAKPALFPSIVGGNQQGYVEYLDENATNDVSLSIKNITGNTITPTVITSIDHNLESEQVIQISGIPTGTPFATNLNIGSTLSNGIFEVEVIDSDNFSLWRYNSTDGEFSIPQLDSPGVYIGGGQIAVRDNFSIVSKKFNNLEKGKQYQLGYIDILMDNTEHGEISLNVYNDYNDNDASNISPDNTDTFFNSIVPTNPQGMGIVGGTKNMQRVFCPTNSNFVTIEWTLSNLQMTNQAQESDVQIDSQIIWSREGGRMGITK